MAQSSGSLVMVVFVVCILVSGVRVHAAIAPRASSAPQLFSTQWPNFPAVLAANSNVNVPFIVGTNDGLDTTQDSPTLALLWTSSTSVLKSSNTWDVLNLTFSCSDEHDGNCSFDPGSSGNANLAVAADPAELPETQAIVAGKFLLCFATAVNASTHAFTCESYSPFFDIILPQVQSSGTATSESVSTTTITVSLRTPTAVLSITRSTKILTSLLVTLGQPSTTLAPDSATIPATVSPTVPGSVSATVSQTPIIPTAPLLPFTGAISSHKGLSAGARAGIAVSVIIIVLIVFIIAFFFCQRRRPASRTEQNHNPDYAMGREVPRELVDKSPISGTSYALSSDITKESPRQLPRAAIEQPLPAPNPAMLALTPPASRDRSQDHSSTSRSPSPRLSAEELSAAEDLDYHDDTPRYGDARHVPLVFQRARFLGEPGMNAQQMAALEEEEKRIDAAIAERERRLKR